MTVSVTKNAVNLREELASLRNQGGYQEQQFYFDGLVTNGTFDVDTSGWSAPNGATLSVDTGRLKVLAPGGTWQYALQTFAVTAGKSYTFKVTGTNGTVAPFLYLGSTSNAFDYAYTVLPNGTEYSATFVSKTNLLSIRINPYATAAGHYAFFDNISVFEVDANDDVIHRMPKGWVPKDVYEDGLLQREGSAHDYEVVYDGFDYYVKPTVAPTATTQTCVIGVKA